MPSQAYETIQWAFDDETGVGSIVLDRPDSLNALSSQLRTDVVDGFQAFREIDADRGGAAVRVVVVEGAGDRAFCAGADINDFASGQHGGFDHGLVYDVPEQFEAPVIAKIDGYCLGGGLVFALGCDFRLASHQSEFGLPEIDRGLIPSGGAAEPLTALVGPSRAKQLAMTGERIDAGQAARDGLIDEAIPSGELDDRCGEFAAAIASKPPLATRGVKDLINGAYRTANQSAFESRIDTNLRRSRDFEEGVAAFREDRDPEWQGE